MAHVRQDLETLESTVNQCIAEMDAQRGRGIQSTKRAELMKILVATQEDELTFSDEQSPTRFEKIAGLISRLKKA